MMQKKFLLCIFCILWYLYIDCSYILVSTVLLVPVNWNIYIYCYTQVTYVVQEAVVVIKDIFRKYPNKYESIISTLCENLDSLDEPEARWERLSV